jgi:FtsH-binding integral membrane protein
LFISDKKYLTRNGAAAVFLLVFALIYEHFSHGVISGYMLGAWLIPLAGSLPYLGSKRLYRRHAAKNGEQRNTAASGLWQLGIFTLSQGFIMKGIIEIYGTTNRWTAVYVPAAAVFFILAAGMAVMKRKESRGNRSVFYGNRSVPSEYQPGSITEREPGKQSGALHPPRRGE